MFGASVGKLQAKVYFLLALAEGSILLETGLPGLRSLCAPDELLGCSVGI